MRFARHPLTTPALSSDTPQSFADSYILPGSGNRGPAGHRRPIPSIRTEVAAQSRVSKRRRMARILPPLFLVLFVFEYWSIAYVCLPFFVGLDERAVQRSFGRSEGSSVIGSFVMQSYDYVAPFVSYERTLVFVTFLASMLIVSYLRAWLSSAGIVESTWFNNTSLADSRERVRKNQCHKCDMLRPIRSHHCRVCEHCVLKMDHHCVWINNCVGFGNYKFFLLFLVYLLVDSFVALSISAVIVQIVHPHRHIFEFCVCIVAIVIALFSIYFALMFLRMHWLLLGKNITTIELQRLQFHWDRAKFFKVKISRTHEFDLGTFANICAVMGPVYMWLLPIAHYPSTADHAWPGYDFAIDRAHLNEYRRAQAKVEEAVDEQMRKAGIITGV